MKSSVNEKFWQLPNIIRQHYVWKMNKIMDIRIPSLLKVQIIRTDGYVDVWDFHKGDEAGWRVTEKQ